MTERDVYYFTRFVLPYRIPILESLNEKLDGKLVVCSGEPPLGSSFETLVGSSQPSYRQIRLRNRWIRGETLHYQHFKSAFHSSEKPGIILAEESPRSLSLPGLLRYGRRHRMGTLLWGHFSSNLRTFGSENPRDRYRLWLAGNVDALVTYTDQLASQLQRSVDPRKVFVARNTLDTRTLFSLYDQLEKEGKRSVRKRLGLPDTNIVLFLGRLILEKGTGLLANTVSKLGMDNVMLLVIGDGPTKASIEDAAASAHISVRFTGSLSKLEESAPFIYASDVLLNPGYLGLSVNHAFSLGLPVVAVRPASEARFHSPEWVYVEDSKNGILVDDMSAATMSEGLRIVLENQEKYSCEAQAYARANLPVERMIDGLADAISYADSVRKNRG